MISISSIVAGRFLPLFSAGRNALRLALRAPSQLTTEPITDCKVCRIPTGFGLVDWLDRTHRQRETLPSHVYEPRSWLVEWSGVPLIKQYHGLSLEPVSQTCCHFRDLRPGGGGNPPPSTQVLMPSQLLSKFTTSISSLPDRRVIFSWVSFSPHQT